jgi:hypothetical protein
MRKLQKPFCPKKDDTLSIGWTEPGVKRVVDV